MKIRLLQKQRSLRLILVALAVVLAPYSFSRFASPWNRVSVHSTISNEIAHAPTARLRIACYNIAHGRGAAESNWKGGNGDERMTRLDQIADLIRNIDADVVVLNEVDFDSSWSCSVNQARYLAERAGYPFWVEERNLDVRILVWKWRFGNAILSRYPINDARCIDLPSYSYWESFLAGKKRSVTCEIEVGKRRVNVVGAHLSHRSENLRVRSAEIIAKKVTAWGLPTVVAGDMNSTPPSFPNTDADADGRNAITTFDQSERFRRSPVAPPTGTDHLTFHSAKPTCIIDWILIPSGWEFLDYDVRSSPLSDHRPVVADVMMGPLPTSPNAD